jgi:hypothetical protein
LKTISTFCGKRRTFTVIFWALILSKYVVAHECKRYASALSRLADGQLGGAERQGGAGR